MSVQDKYGTPQRHRRSLWLWWALTEVFVAAFALAVALGVFWVLSLFWPWLLDRGFFSVGIGYLAGMLSVDWWHARKRIDSAIEERWG
jgi:hypothetical protein